jgi:hypothetical protein
LCVDSAVLVEAISVAIREAEEETSSIILAYTAVCAVCSDESGVEVEFNVSSNDK